MVAVDSISALPLELKLSILSRLPIADTVRTSVLSRSWRRVWTFLPGFNLDIDFIYDERFRWIQVIDHLLSSIRGPIHFFHLFHIGRTFEAPHLNRFLDLIFQKGGPEKFSFCSIKLVQLRLPYFQSLKDLNLSWVHLCLPPGFQGFDQLVSLRLSGVCISRHDIHALVSHSRRLTSFEGEELIPTDYEEPLLVTFDCPLLESLRFNFEIPFAQARVASAPRLQSAYATTSAAQGGVTHSEELALLAPAIMKFLADVAHISNLSIDSKVLMVIPPSLNFIVSETEFNKYYRTY